jgi:hypothetical protein
LTKEKNTYPKDTDVIERTERRPVRLDHAKHAMQLPVDEEDDKQMVRVPKALKVGPTSLFHRKPDNNHQTDEHYPTGDPRPSCEVHQQEVHEYSAGRG